MLAAYGEVENAAACALAFAANLAFNAAGCDALLGDSGKAMRLGDAACFLGLD